MASDTWHNIRLFQVKDGFQERDEKRQQALGLAKAANHVEQALTTVHSINKIMGEKVVDSGVLRTDLAKIRAAAKAAAAEAELDDKSEAVDIVIALEAPVDEETGEAIYTCRVMTPVSEAVDLGRRITDDADRIASMSDEDFLAMVNDLGKVKTSA